MNLQALVPSEVISRANSLHLFIRSNHFDTAHPDDVLGGRHDASAGQHAELVECPLYHNPLSLLLSGLEIRRTFRVNCVWVGSYNIWRLQCPRPIQIYTIISQDMIRRSTCHPFHVRSIRFRFYFHLYCLPHRLLSRSLEGYHASFTNDPRQCLLVFRILHCIPRLPTGTRCTQRDLLYQPHRSRGQSGRRWRRARREHNQ